MIDDALAQTIADKVAPLIVNQLSPSTSKKTPEETWKVVVNLIVKEVFKQIKDNAVVKLDTIAVSPASPQVVLQTSAGPVAGTFSPASTPVTGKIT